MYELGFEYLKEYFIKRDPTFGMNQLLMILFAFQYFRSQLINIS